MKFQYQLSPKDLSAHLFYNYWHSPKQKKWRRITQYVLPLVALVSGTYLLFWGTTIWGNIYGGIVVAVGIALIFFPKIFQYRIDRQSEAVAKHPQGKLLFEPTQIEITDDNVIFALQNESYEPLVLPKSALLRIEHSPEHLALVYEDQTRILPKRILADQQESFLAALENK